jgi:hypothetical protein
MRAAFSALENAILAFIEQPDYPAMILNVRDADIVYPSTILRNLDRTAAEPIVLVFPGTCDEVGHYFDAMIEILGAQAATVAQARAVEGLDPWPPVPLVCQDPRAPAGAKLEAAARWVREAIAPPRTIVWGLLPSSLRDQAGYRRLIEPVLGLGGVPPASSCATTGRPASSCRSCRLPAPPRPWCWRSTSRRNGRRTRSCSRPTTQTSPSLRGCRP